MDFDGFMEKYSPCNLFFLVGCHEFMIMLNSLCENNIGFVLVHIKLGVYPAQLKPFCIVRICNKKYSKVTSKWGHDLSSYVEKKRRRKRSSQAME